MTAEEKVAEDDVRRIDCMEAPSKRPQAIAASSLDQEFHSHQGAALDPRLYISIDTALLMNGGDDRASSCLIQNRRGPGWEVGSHALLEVEGELGVR
jgi:hypothetical protein